MVEKPFSFRQGRDKRPIGGICHGKFFGNPLGQMPSDKIRWFQDWDCFNLPHIAEVAVTRHYAGRFRFQRTAKEFVVVGVAAYLNLPPGHDETGMGMDHPNPCLNLIRHPFAQVSECRLVFPKNAGTGNHLKSARFPGDQDLLGIAAPEDAGHQNVGVKDYQHDALFG